MNRTPIYAIAAKVISPLSECMMRSSQGTKRTVLSKAGIAVVEDIFSFSSSYFTNKKRKATS